jgi:hypothetical protein
MTKTQVSELETVIAENLSLFFKLPIRIFDLR